MGPTHNASQGFCITSFGSNLPYLRLCHLFTWHVWWQFLTYFQMVFRIPFQYIAARSVSQGELLWGIGGSNGTNLLHYTEGQQEEPWLYLCTVVCFPPLFGALGIIGQFVDFGVSFWSHCHFLDREAINDVFFAATHKHQVYGGLVYYRLLCHSVRCIVAPPLGEGHQGFPLILCRAVVQTKESIGDCVVDRAILFQE